MRELLVGRGAGRSQTITLPPYGVAWGDARLTAYGLAGRAGFHEAGTIWQRLDNRVLGGRPSGRSAAGNATGGGQAPPLPVGASLAAPVWTPSLPQRGGGWGWGFSVWMRLAYAGARPRAGGLAAARGQHRLAARDHAARRAAHARSRPRPRRHPPARSARAAARAGCAPACRPPRCPSRGSSAPSGSNVMSSP